MTRKKGLNSSLEKNLNRRDFIKKSGLFGLGIAGTIVLGAHFSCSDKEKLERLRDYCDIKRTTVKKDDKYWIYASELEKKYPFLLEVDKREIVYFLKNELNGGRELYAGKSVNLPVYECF